jgi:hypothetical protein
MNRCAEAPEGSDPYSAERTPFLRLSNLSASQPNRKEIANHSRENESGEPRRQTLGKSPAPFSNRNLLVDGAFLSGINPLHNPLSKDRGI